VAIAIRNQDRADTKRVELRIGINVGDVLVEGLDLFGGGINVAARLEASVRLGVSRYRRARMIRSVVEWLEI
jgi:adenylate cyclase